MTKINPNSTVSLYMQLAQVLKTQISLNQLRPGDKIPSEEELGKEYEISRVTVRKALQYLCDEQILVKKHGKGTYVSTPSLIEDVTLLESFSGYCSINNLTATTKLISRSLISATTEVALKLGVLVGDDVIEVRRLRLIDDVPAIFEIDYFRKNDNFILEMDFSSESLLASVMNNSSLDVHAFSDEIKVEEGDVEISKHMIQDEFFKYLVVNEIVLSYANDIVYFNKQYINSDIYTYKIKTFRGG